MLKKITVAGLAAFSVLTTTALPSQAASDWACRAGSWQNDGDAGGRSMEAKWLYDYSLKNQARGTFMAKDELLTLKNGTGHDAALSLWRTGAQSPTKTLRVKAGSSATAFANLSMGEGADVYLVLSLGGVGRCVAQGGITFA